MPWSDPRHPTRPGLGSVHHAPSEKKGGSHVSIFCSCLGLLDWYFDNFDIYIYICNIYIYIHTYKFWLFFSWASELLSLRRDLSRRLGNWKHVGPKQDMQPANKFGDNYLLMTCDESRNSQTQFASITSYLVNWKPKKDSSHVKWSYSPPKKSKQQLTSLDNLSNRTLENQSEITAEQHGDMVLIGKPVSTNQSAPPQ